MYTKTCYFHYKQLYIHTHIYHSIIRELFMYFLNYLTYDILKFRSCIEAFATKVAPLAESLAEILVSKLNMKSSYFRENCFPKSSFIRLNRYPPCPFSSKVYGLIPHSDTSFLTIVHQDQVRGLQLMKDGKWVGVKPNPRALVVNIGDLFQVKPLHLF